MPKGKETLIFGNVNKVYKDDVNNAILLNIKYYIYIYTNRCLKKKLSFHSLKACLINLYKTEKMIAVWNQRIAEFQLHWSTFEKLFEDCWHIFYSYVNSLSIETQLNIKWDSLSKYTFLGYIYYTIVYFIVYLLWDN